MQPSLFDTLDLYCERTSAAFWAEPLNALSNLAFIAAGIWGLLLAGRCGSEPWVKALAWGAVAVGIGSGLFHTVASRLTMWADILPIAIFTLAYTLFALRRLAGLGWGASIAGFVGFYAVAGVLTALVPASLREATNGTSGYLAPFLAFFVIGGVVLARGNPAGWYTLAAGLIFVLSAIFRMVDPIVCGSFSLGTHFLWHVFNGLMIAVLLTAACGYGAPQGAVRR
jgi:hypothetical protein